MEQKYYGYIYLITNKLTKQIYIGKKAYLHRIKKKLTKKELDAITKKGRKPKYKIEYVDSGWKDYWGSSKRLKEDIEKYGKENFSMKILKKCKTRKGLTYFEVYYQFKYDVLNKDTYNDNVLSRFFRRDLELEK